MITAAFGMASHFHGTPSALEVVLFGLGAVLAVSLIETLASRGFRRRPDTHPQEVLLLGTAGNVVSVIVSLGVTYIAAGLLPDPAAWAVPPLLAAGVYVLVEAVELAVAEDVQEKVFGDQDAESRQ
ncbi:MAG: hypothetical protein ACRDN9_05955 [Streptosporangiaceae bacterium]